jgi:hypothetical protein
MTDIPESETSKLSSEKPKRRQFVKPSELIIGLLFIGLVAVLLITLINKITLKRDVSDARTVSSKVIIDIQARNGDAIWRLGSPKFQRAYSPADLTEGFIHLEVATLKTPTLDDQFVVTTSSGRTVFFIYKYTALKVPFYVRTAITHQAGHWYLTGIAGNADETQLTS